jgi:hypothetical protein
MILSSSRLEWGWAARERIIATRYFCSKAFRLLAGVITTAGAGSAYSLSLNLLAVSPYSTSV